MINIKDSTAEYKKTILKILNDARLNALRADRKATADHAAAVASHAEWEKHNDLDNIGWLANPYNVTHAEELRRLQRKHHDYMQKVYDYAVNTFVSDEN